MLRLFVFSCPGSYDCSVTSKLGAVDGNRTRLSLIDNQMPYPEDYHGKTWKSIGESNSSSQDENLMS